MKPWFGVLGLANPPGGLKMGPPGHEKGPHPEPGPWQGRPSGGREGSMGQWVERSMEEDGTVTVSRSLISPWIVSYSRRVARMSLAHLP
jgi:hypothetical protein